EGVRPSFGLPGGELLQRLRQADSSVKLAAGMAATTVLLLIIVVMILIVRFTSDGPRTDPFVSYERAIEVGLASARAQFQAEAWDNAVRSYRDVLDQDPINPD